MCSSPEFPWASLRSTFFLCEYDNDFTHAASHENLTEALPVHLSSYAVMWADKTSAEPFYRTAYRPHWSSGVGPWFWCVLSDL